MYDLLAAMLDWDPTSRLGMAGGHAALKAHPYWGEVDWELVDAKRVPSPLRQLVAERIAKRVHKWEAEAATGGRGVWDVTGGGGAKSSQHTALKVINELNKAQEQQRTVNKRRSFAGGDDDSFTAGKAEERFSIGGNANEPASPPPLSAEHVKLVEREEEMSVEGWDFVSEYALAQVRNGRRDRRPRLC